MREVVGIREPRQKRRTYADELLEHLEDELRQIERGLQQDEAAN